MWSTWCTRRRSGGISSWGSESAELTAARQRDASREPAAVFMQTIALMYMFM